MREHVYRVSTSALHSVCRSFPSTVCWSSKQNCFFPLCSFSVNRVMKMLPFILLILTRQLSKAFSVPEHCCCKFINKCTQRQNLSPLGFMEYLGRRHCQVKWKMSALIQYEPCIDDDNFFTYSLKVKGFLKCGMIFQHVQKKQKTSVDQILDKIVLPVPLYVCNCSTMF